jgi:hypothetical protein
MNDKPTYRTLTISAAVDKGHFVHESQDDSNRGLYRPILFAGDLEQCLEWVRSRIHDE